jgi:hypothetical protein
MKSFLTKFAMVVLITTAVFSFKSDAQTCEGPPILFEDFNQDSIPPSWTILNMDTNTLYATSDAKGYTGEWQHYNHFGRKCATNCSRFNDMTDSPDDYLITPLVHLGSSSCLSWKAAKAYDSPVFNDEQYEVLISTSGANVAGFQVYPSLIVVIETSAFWTEHSIDLTAYAGQDVNIAFHHYAQSNGYSLSLDDIRIAQSVNVDVKISSVSVNDIIHPGSSVTISGVLYNGGFNAITSATLHWSIDNGAVHDLPLTGLTIPQNGSQNFTFPQTWNASFNGTYLLRVWADQVNGTADQYNDNDTLSKYIFVSTQQRKVLQEEFTQASCPPCADENPAYDQLLAQNRIDGKVTLIKYHVGWPGVDPMNDFNAVEAEERVISMGVTGVPCAWSDGVEVPTCAGYFPGAPACLTQQNIDDQVSIPSIFDILIATSKNGNDYNLSYSITATNDFPLTTFRVYAALIEDSINYGLPPGTNGETEFPQVMRKMFPTTDGVILPTLAAGQSFSQSFTTPILIDYVEDMLRVIVFVEDNETRIIYQSEMTDQQIVSGIEKNNINEISLRAYPQPAKDKIYISGIQKASDIISCDIINTLGESVCPAVSVSAIAGGIDVSNLKDGIYLLRLKKSDGNIGIRFIKE